MTKLFRIYPKSARIFPCDKWYRDFEKAYICSGYGCGRLLPFIYKDKVQLNIYIDEKPNNAALNVVHPGINIARRDFLDLFKYEVDEYLQTGSVFLSDGTILDK